VILPTKHIPENQAILGTGAVIIRELVTPQTLSGLWEKLKMNNMIGTYDRFVLSLDLLSIIGAIKMEEGLIVRQLP
jgi:hypothetical protein